MKVIAITWFDHRRTTELCVGLGLPLRSITTRRKGLVRYLELTWRTVRELFGTRPHGVLVQNPSLVLAALMVGLRPLFRYRLVVDAHNEAVQPVINRSSLILWVTHWILRRADLTIVTNRQLADQVVARCGLPFVLPDRVPAAPAISGKNLHGSFRVVLICTYAIDEPLAAIFEAVRGLDLHLYVTGNDRKCSPQLRAIAPPNVIFAGFLSETDYWEYLAASDAIIDLTTMPNCLVCGGYEAAALGKPLLLTRSDAACELFGDGAVYTDNTVDDIRVKLEYLGKETSELQSRMRKRRDKMMLDWGRESQKLLSQLHPSAVGGNQS